MQIAFDIYSLSFWVLILWAGSLLVQLLYYWGLFSRLAFHKKQEIDVNKINYEPVSVVLSARSELQNLEKFMPLLLAQDYPEFEVVVVNDCSDDETEEFLTELSRENPRLKPVHLRQSLNFFKGKKFPLSMGIKSAKHDLLVLTDADCFPESDKWLKTMVEAYQPQTEVLLAYGPYERQNGLLNLLIRFDTIHIAIQYLSMALAGIPYMGVGRNLSYRKSLFLRNKGFTAHYNIASGDDDLFISQVANKKNTSILVTSSERMLSNPKQSFIDWIRQKRRHYSTGFFYKRGVKLLLGMYTTSQFVFYGGFIALLFLLQAIQTSYDSIVYYAGLLLLFMIRYVTQLIVFGRVSQKLGEKGLLPILLIADFFFVIFTPLLGLSNLFIKAPKWK